MKIFEPLYDKALQWAAHRHAPSYLAGLSFAESTFFPVPPDVMLVPMVLARPQRGWWFAFLCTVASVIGGLAGWLIGAFFFDAIEPWLAASHYWEGFVQAQQYFERYGFWVIFLAGFSPIPYKVFTISAGVIGMAVAPFLLASLVGRGARFFIEAALVIQFGEPVAARMKQHIEWLGWAMVALVIVVVVYLNL